MQKTLFTLMLLTLSFYNLSAQRKPANGRANENYIWVYNKNHLQKVFPIGTVRSQFMNGQINIAATCEKSSVFEINGLQEALMKDTIIQDGEANLVFIREGKAGVWKNTSHKVKSMRITCASNNPGTPIRIWVKATINKGKESRIVEVQFNSRVPEKQYLKNDIH